jgi:hypothetical protein
MKRYFFGSGLSGLDMDRILLHLINQLTSQPIIHAAAAMIKPSVLFVKIFFSLQKIFSIFYFIVKNFLTFI